MHIPTGTHDTTLIIDYHVSEVYEFDVCEDEAAGDGKGIIVIRRALSGGFQALVRVG